MDSGFLAEAALERLGEGAQSLFDGRDAEAFWFRRTFVRQVGLTCRLFTPKFHFLFFGHFWRWTHAAH